MNDFEQHAPQGDGVARSFHYSARMDFQAVKNLNHLRRGGVYDLRVRSASDEDGSEPPTISGEVEWVRTEPYHNEWGHVKLKESEDLIHVDADEWLEARLVGGTSQPRVSLQDLVHRLEQEEERAMEINHQAERRRRENGGDALTPDQWGTYWEGYMMALRKARQLIKEFQIVVDWLDE